MIDWKLENEFINLDQDERDILATVAGNDGRQYIEFMSVATGINPDQVSRGICNLIAKGACTLHVESVTIEGEEGDHDCLLTALSLTQLGYALADEGPDGHKKRACYCRSRLFGDQQ